MADHWGPCPACRKPMKKGTAQVFCNRDEVFIHESCRHDRAAGDNRMCCLEDQGVSTSPAANESAAIR